MNYSLLERGEDQGLYPFAGYSQRVYHMLEQEPGSRIWYQPETGKEIEVEQKSIYPQLR